MINDIYISLLANYHPINIYDAPHLATAAWQRSLSLAACGEREYGANHKIYF
jgi:hypothetical protein